MSISDMHLYVIPLDEFLRNALLFVDVCQTQYCPVCAQSNLSVDMTAELPHLLV